jgi:hypothetical protein
MTESNAQPAPPESSDPEIKSFFDTLRGALFASIPALSVLVFIVVAVKVFRASRMETTTTVAIVSTADVVALLKGVILTLLPGFLAALTAAAIWWWAGVLPEHAEGADPRRAATRALLCPQAILAWALIVMAFFTVWWPIFLVLLLPVLFVTGVLIAQSLGRRLLATVPLRRTLRVFGLVAAAVFVGLLTLEPSVWLPLRTITVAKGTLTLNGKALPHQFPAYVLSSDEHGASLLLNDPRAVIQVGPNEIEKSMPLCVPPESRWRVLTLRASQVLGIDADPHSPYDVCPELPRRFV